MPSTARVSPNAITKPWVSIARVTGRSFAMPRTVRVEPQMKSRAGARTSCPSDDGHGANSSANHLSQRAMSPWRGRRPIDVTDDTRAVVVLLQHGDEVARWP